MILLLQRSRSSFVVVVAIGAAAAAARWVLLAVVAGRQPVLLLLQASRQCEHCCEDRPLCSERGASLELHEGGSALEGARFEEKEE